MATTRILTNRTNWWKLPDYKILFGILTFFTFLFANSCTAKEEDFLVFVGTYTGHGSDGIYAWRFNPATGEINPIGLVAKTDNPSFLTIDSSGQFLYAVNEIDTFKNQATGAVSAFSINMESGKLKLLQQISSLGAAPAHLSLDKTGHYLMVANYTGGNVAVFPVESDGHLGQSSSFIQNAGSGGNPERQGSPHAHFISATAGNNFVMVADLGIDKVLIHRFDATTGSLTPSDAGFVKLNPGDGPRHLAFSPSGKFVYVLNELSSTIAAFSFETEKGEMKILHTISTLPEKFAGSNTAAEILVDAKGKFLYVSNRGDNSIGLFDINNSNGNLTPVEWISCGGKDPRNIEIDPTGQWLFAANQNSNNIVIFRIDQANGRLTQTKQTLKINAPICVRFIQTCFR